MKKTIHSVLSTALLVASLAASAADMKGMPMKDMPMNGAPREKAHHAKGTVKKIHAAKGAVTIAHEPVASLKWPSMTMAFRASPVTLETLKPGQVVDFEFVVKGMDATITKLGSPP